MDSMDALSRSRYREQRLNNHHVRARMDLFTSELNCQCSEKNT